MLCFQSRSSFQPPDASMYFALPCTSNSPGTDPEDPLCCCHCWRRLWCYHGDYISSTQVARCFSFCAETVEWPPCWHSKHHFAAQAKTEDLVLLPVSAPLTSNSKQPNTFLSSKAESCLSAEHHHYSYKVKKNINCTLENQPTHFLLFTQKV